MKLDLGAGTKKQEGFIGVDVRLFPGVDVVCDLGKDPWPWQDDTVDEVYCSHMAEHLTAPERIHFANELGRVMKKGAKAQIITPNWASCRAYGDLTHQWPPVSEFWFIYLNKEWREREAPHSDAYTCDFDHTVSYSTSPTLAGKNQEYVSWALGHLKEAAWDICASLTKR